MNVNSSPRGPRVAALSAVALAAVAAPLLLPSAAFAVGAEPVCPQAAVIRGTPIVTAQALSEFDPHAAASISAGTLPPGVVLEGDETELKPYRFSGTPTAEGTFHFTVKASYVDSGPRTVGCTVTVVKPPTTTRVQGTDRYDQAARVSKSAFDTAETVYLASGEKFPDALSAGSVAGIHGAPLLLTQAGALPVSTKAEIARLHPKDIVVVGGPASVATTVTDGLARDFGAAKVTRIAGADRYSGSRALIMHPTFGAPSSAFVYIATGADFPDALAASPAAVSMNAPVMLVDGSKPALSDAETGLLRGLGVSAVHIAGGPSSVSAALEASLRGGSLKVERFHGADRHEGAVALNGVFGAADTVYFASSALFPDALSGAPAAARQSAPIYLLPKDCVPRSVLADVARLRTTKVVVLGGTGTLGTEVDRLKAC